MPVETMHRSTHTQEGAGANAADRDTTVQRGVGTQGGTGANEADRDTTVQRARPQTRSLPVIQRSKKVHLRNDTSIHKQAFAHACM